MLGLPESIRGCLFDLDGVLTQTAKVHDAAWKEMFDDFLRKRATQRPVAPFDPVADYDDYVDGKPRDEGTRSFLESRGIDLPLGNEADPPDAEHRGLGNRKNEIVLRRLAKDGVQTYPGSVKYVQAVKKAGLRRAVVSSSTNCQQVLEAAGIADLFEARIDGIVAEREHLHGKPAPGHVPGRGQGARTGAGRLHRVRGRARWSRRREGRRFRLRGRGRPGRPG